MNYLKHILTVFLLTLFVTYSSGIGFFVHNCEHCRQKKVYLFQHPDCCSAAKAEHHHQADDCENRSNHDADCCHHQADKTLKNADAPHCQPCCFTEFQFFKIYENYLAQKQEQLINSTDFLLFAEVLSFHSEQHIIKKIHFPKNNLNPPPLLPGGERFIVFSHQLLFYA